MDHLSAAGSSATRNLTTTEPSESLNRRKTVDFRFQRPYATSGSFFFNKPMRAMDSRRDFTSKKVFSGYFSELGENANSALIEIRLQSWLWRSLSYRRKAQLPSFTVIHHSHHASPCRTWLRSIPPEPKITIIPSFLLREWKLLLFCFRYYFFGS